MRFSTWEGMWNNYQLVLVCLKHWGCRNLFVNMLPNVYHVTYRFGINWAKIPNNIKKEWKNLCTKTTKTSPPQFRVFLATIVVLLILHLSTFEPRIKSKENNTHS
jgi:hypothetical protein